MAASKRISVIRYHLCSSSPSTPFPRNLNHEQGIRNKIANACPAKYSQKEWKQRCDLAVLYRIAGHQRWDQVIFNHITLKVDDSEDLPDGPHFLINPFGLLFSEVTASSLLKVSISGKIIDAGDGSGELLDQGFIVHSAVHAARKDINCIIHNHHQPTVAVAMSTHGLLPLSQEAAEIFETISYHPFEGTATDLRERERMARSLGPTNKILILENHGPLSGGSTIPEALFRMQVLTRACEYQQKALAAVGGDLTKLHMPSEKTLDEMLHRHRENVKKKHKYNPGDLMFRALRREMEKKYGPNDIYV